MRTIIAVLLAVLSQTVQADAMVHRESVRQLFVDMHESCQSFYSMYPAGIVCNQDRKYRRMYEVTYSIQGYTGQVTMSSYPPATFCVMSNGEACANRDTMYQNDSNDRVEKEGQDRPTNVYRDIYRETNTYPHSSKHRRW